MIMRHSTGDLFILLPPSKAYNLKDGKVIRLHREISFYVNHTENQQVAPKELSNWKS